jgi:hypothetical protein
MGGQVGGWVAKFVARLLATATLWVQIQTSLKKTKKMGYISKGMANMKKIFQNQ